MIHFGFCKWSGNKLCSKHRSLYHMMVTTRSFLWKTTQSKPDSPSNQQKAVDSKSKDDIDVKFKNLFEFCRDSFPYRCGNDKEFKSNYWYFKRRKLEKQLNYSNLKAPPFLFAYRAFFDALKSNDFKTIKAMCEPQFYDKLKLSLFGIEDRNGQILFVDERIKMKYKLIDLKLIEGLYINRKENAPYDQYNVEEMGSSIIFKRKDEKIKKVYPSTDFSKLFDERKPVESKEATKEEIDKTIKEIGQTKAGYQGTHGKSQSVQDDDELKKEIIDKLKLEEEKSFDKNLQIMRVELQFTSNMRMAIALNGYENDTRYIIGFPK